MLYQSSKGAVDIDTMPLTYAANALVKLRRTDPERSAEIEALQAHVDKLADTNPRVVIGGNNPPEELPATGDPAPELDGREAIETHVADMLSEAANWADGVALINQGQADDVGRLHRQLQQAAGLVDEAATKEKKPHNDAITEIAAWQNSFTAKGLKKTPDGSLTKAIMATGNLSAGWLRKMDDDRREREKLAADAANKAAQEAIAARTEARTSTDLEVIDRAEDALAMAESLIREAKGVASERVMVGGGEGMRAVTLRSVWHAEVSAEDGGWGSAYGFFKQDAEFMAEFHALIQKWADRAVRTEATRLRGVPGFNFIEEKVV
jgi:hypothetical protein